MATDPVAQAVERGAQRREAHKRAPRDGDLSWAKNDMFVGVVVRYGAESTTTQIQANGASQKDPILYLRQAVSAIQAEIDSYSRCPMHQGKP